MDVLLADFLIFVRRCARQALLVAFLAPYLFLRRISSCAVSLSAKSADRQRPSRELVPKE
jgi:hypothetical protein